MCLFSLGCLRKWSNLTSIFFSNGVVQPPTSQVHQCHLIEQWGYSILFHVPKNEVVSWNMRSENIDIAALYGGGSCHLPYPCFTSWHLCWMTDAMDHYFESSPWWSYEALEKIHTPVWMEGLCYPDVKFSFHGSSFSRCNAGEMGLIPVCPATYRRFEVWATDEMPKPAWMAKFGHFLVRSLKGNPIFRRK